MKTKFASLITVLVIGVILGLQTAEQGIYKVDGLPEQQTRAYTITKLDKGQMEIAVMGKQVKTIPERKSNYVSSFGRTMGIFIKGTAKAFVDWFASFFQP
ncbi:MAG: DUF3679 domain-containing protein [Clostridia bacterium]